jgi:energy-coupling factor transporter ATP-binding protein EcfA2
MIDLRGLTKIYKTGDEEVFALKDLNLIVEKGEFVVIVGPSGCGKSTLLNLIGGIDTPTNWPILLNEFLKILLFSLIGISIGIPIAMQLSDLFALTFRNLISPPNTVPIPSIMLSRSFIVLGISLFTVVLTTALILRRNIAERLRRAFETI